MDENRQTPVDPVEEEEKIEQPEEVQPEAEAEQPEVDEAVMAAEREAKKAAIRKRVLKEIREWVVSLAVAVIVVLVLRTFVFIPIRVDGKSMYDTLDNNERLFTTAYDIRFGEVERGDIVICHYPGRKSALLGFIEPIQVNTNFVKRVVAVPGDRVYCRDGSTHVIHSNEAGELVDEALDNGIPYLKGLNYDEYTLGEDEYFVVGDNRYNSHDSRFWAEELEDYSVGPITKDMIIGHVRCVFWPLNKIRTVK